MIVSLLARLAKMERAASNMNHAISLVTGKGDSLLEAMNNVSDVRKEQQKALKEELFLHKKYHLACYD